MKLEKDFLEAIKESIDGGTKGYEANATVLSVDGSTAWVHIDGGVEKTPAIMAMSCSKDDRVRVKIDNGTAYVTGNITSPPTDDKLAIGAQKQAEGAIDAAGQAKASSEAATKAASEAVIAANNAENASADAKSLADQANSLAEEAGTLANSANETAKAAKESADDAVKKANESATALEPVKSDVASLKTASDDQAKAIEGIKNDVSSHYAEQTETAKLVETQGTKIDQNANNISSQATKISSLETDVSAAQQKATDAASAASAAQIRADNAQKQADAANSAAETAQTAADDAAAKAKTANDNLAIAQKSLEDVQAQANATDADLATAKENVTKAQAAADAANTAATNAQTAADNAKAAATTAQSTADQAQKDAKNAADTAKDTQDDVNALTTRVTSAETKIDQNADAIALRATKTEVSEKIGDLGEYKTVKEYTDAKIKVSSDSITSTVSKEIDDKLKDVQVDVGGRNYFVNSIYFQNETPFTTTSTSTDNHLQKFNEKYIYTNVPFKAGDKISLQAKSNLPWTNVHGGSKSNKNKVGFWLYLGTRDQAKSGSYTSPLFLEGDNLTTFDKTITLPTVSGLSEYYIGFRFDTYSDGTTSVTGKFWNLKLELGNTTTDWTPAPEDLATVDYTNSKLTQTSKNILLAVSESYSTKKELNDVSSNINDKIQDNIDTINEVSGRTTTLEQTASSLTVNFNKTKGTVDTLTSWIVVGQDEVINSDGSVSYVPYIMLGDSTDDQSVKTKLSNGELGFYNKGNKVAYVSENKLYISVAQVTKSVQIDHLGDDGVRTNGWEWTTRSNKNLILRKVD